MNNSSDNNFLIEKSLDSKNYDNTLEQFGFSNKFLSILYKDTDSFTTRNNTYFEFDVPKYDGDISYSGGTEYSPPISPTTTYQIYLSGTWFGRIQEEYIEILDESLNNVPIHFDQSKYENYKNYAWHNNDILTVQSNQIHIKTLPRITDAYYWIMNGNNSPFTITLQHGKKL